MNMLSGTRQGDTDGYTGYLWIWSLSCKWV